MTPTRNIAILGSTGSVGESALQVIEAIESFHLVAISGHRNLERLREQAWQFRPAFAVAADARAAQEYDFSLAEHQLPPETELLTGPEGLITIATDSQVDTVLAAIVGIAGLPSTFAAVEAGRRIALANKESLVVAGHLLTRAADHHGAEIIPVDSEHSAIFQALQSGKHEEIERVVLTASGGPFREFTREQMATVTAEDALCHPTWNMGRKISIDSATMMNKSLELIEAKWLFQLDANQIDVVVHPQSIVHSVVEFVDGSCLAQLSPPDMKLPIQYAFSYPHRVAGPSPRLDWSQSRELTFLPPDPLRFPALELGLEVARLGGTCGAVLNAANEAAVDAFLNQQIGFNDIAVACREILDQHHFDPFPDLAAIDAADRWAREEISQWMIA